MGAVLLACWGGVGGKAANQFLILTHSAVTAAMWEANETRLGPRIYNLALQTQLRLPATMHKTNRKGLSSNVSIALSKSAPSPALLAYREE